MQFGFKAMTVGCQGERKTWVVSQLCGIKTIKPVVILVTLLFSVRAPHASIKSRTWDHRVEDPPAAPPLSTACVPTDPDSLSPARQKVFFISKPDVDDREI